MSQKTKKQHYVPQCYLKRWDFSGAHQVYVYDKVQDKYRINNVEDIASERYFYDLNKSDRFSSSLLEELRENTFLSGYLSQEQSIEHFFDEEIEKPFSTLLSKITAKVPTLTPWHIKNCYFINEEEKKEFSVYLAFQFLRTKKARQVIGDTCNLINQWLSDSKSSAENFARLGWDEDEKGKTQIEMLFNLQSLSEFVKSFYEKTWVLGINATEKKFFTSDNPIGTIGHLHNQYCPNNGIGSKGVEIFYPLSPDIVLMMVDDSYHTTLRCMEKRYHLLESTDEIDEYNAVIAQQSIRFVFSIDKDMSVIEELKKKYPSILTYPQVVLHAGDKTFFPNK